MSIQTAPRGLFFIWLAVVASPIAWGASLIAMSWLTHPVCQGLSRSVLILSGTLCALVALGATLGAFWRLQQARVRSAEDLDGVAVFLLRLAMWEGLIFALVIALSLIPTALLTPCPV